MPVIKCTMEDGSGGYKVEGTNGCPHKTREEAQKQEQAIKINQSKATQYEEEASEVEVTTYDNGHIHTYREGDSRTSTDMDHSHRVIDGRILEENDHTHEFRE